MSTTILRQFFWGGAGWAAAHERTHTDKLEQPQRLQQIREEQRGRESLFGVRIGLLPRVVTSTVDRGGGALIVGPIASPCAAATTPRQTASHAPPNAAAPSTPLPSGVFAHAVANVEAAPADPRPEVGPGCREPDAKGSTTATHRPVRPDSPATGFVPHSAAPPTNGRLAESGRT